MPTMKIKQAQSGQTKNPTDFLRIRLAATAQRIRRIQVAIIKNPDQLYMTARRGLFLLAALPLFALSSCRHHAGLPDPGSKPYADLVHAFNVGLAGLQSGADIRAKEGLTQATQIAPGEPAPWADLGILA